jgi:hypothetical protein
MSSVAEENNNPGNLRPPKGVTYEGQIGVDDKGFAIFENQKYGRQALINDIEHKVGRGLDNPHAFIDTYAPVGDNNEESNINYKIHLANRLGLNNTMDKFPEKSYEQIADAITEFESGIKPQEPSYTVPPIPNQGKPLATGKTNGSAPSQVFQIPEPIAAVAGGLGGASAGSYAAVNKAKLDAYKDAYEALNKGNLSSTISPTQVTPTQTSGQILAEDGSLIPSEEQHTRAFEGTKKEKGITGRASQTTYNLRTQQIAEEARKQKQIMEELKKLGILTGETKPLSQMGSVASTNAGIIAPTQAVESMVANQVPQQIASKIPSQFGSYLKGLISMPLKGAFLGATAGLGAADVYNRLANKDNEGAGVATVGTISPLLAPFISSAGLLPAISLASPLYLGASDRLKYLEKHPEEYQLDTNEYDPMGNRQR